jgi:DNA primase
MPGIDFAAVRASVSLMDVLQLLGFCPVQQRGDRLRGACPFGCKSTPRDFAAYLDTNSYHCFSCHRSGNQLELWAAVQRLCLYEAAEDLCHQLNIQVPFIYRW